MGLLDWFRRGSDRGTRVEPERTVDRSANVEVGSPAAAGAADAEETPSDPGQEGRVRVGTPEEAGEVTTMHGEIEADALEERDEEAGRFQGI